MALTQVKTTGLADDAVTVAKIPNGTITGAKLAADTVAEANMANDAIGLAELKAGTDGQILTFDASGDPAFVGPGTDGQVLTSTGAGSPPAFEALPASGVTVSNNVNDRVVTGDGTNLNAEAGLTCDGTHLSITDGNLVIATAGHGIDFSAQTATSASGSSATSELLDHYEEGTWTPDLRGFNHGTGSWGSWAKDAAGSVSGKYIRVGSICHAWFQWTGLDVATNHQYPSISGLPFSGDGTRGHGSSGYEDFFTNSTTVTVKVSGTNMEPICDSNSNPVMNENSGRSMYAGMTYKVA